MVTTDARPVVIDLESVASPHVEELLDPIRAPAHYKDPNKIALYQMDKLAERIATASLEADLCEIVAVGLDDGEPQLRTRAEADEREMLEWFWDRIGYRRMLGFNIMAFDLPVLIRRSQLLNVPRPTISVDRYRSPHIDLLMQLSFNGALTFRSLNFYARRFGVACPDDPVQGADIPGLVAEGKWDLVFQHLLCDIVKTKALAERLGWLAEIPAVRARPTLSHW